MSIVQSCMRQATGQPNDNGIDEFKTPKSRKNTTQVATQVQEEQKKQTTQQQQPQEDKDNPIATNTTRAREVIIREDRRNYRKHSEQNLKLIGRSLDNYGAGRSIVADNSGAVIGGNGTLREANKRGIKQRIIHTNGDELVVVVRDDIAPDDPRRQELAVMDNSTTDSSEFDFDLLQSDFSIPELENFGVIVPDIDLGDDEEFNDGETDPDAVPETPEEPKSKRGCVYQLGEHRLMCGDSTSADDVAKLMSSDPNGADMWLSDPPYNVAVQGGNHGNPNRTNGLKIKNDNMDDATFREFLRSAFDAVFTHIKPGASFYIFHADSEGYNFRGAIHDCGQKVRQCLVWKKQSIVMGRQDYQWIHEPILYGWKEGAAHKWNSDRCQTTVLEFNRPLRNDVHPTMKPIDILVYLIGNSSDSGDVVIDTFGGSGSTLIACEQCGRICRTMELDEKYVDVIRKRYAEFAHGEGCDWEKLTPEC